MSILARNARSARPSFATAIVIWILAVATVIVVELQTTSFREATAGREAITLLRARWAARAGIEATIARLGFATTNPDLTDAFGAEFEMEDVAMGSLEGSAYIVRVSTEGDDMLGPSDAHAKININTMSRDSLMLLTFMTDDVADAILDWIDDDDDTRTFGAESGSYATQRHPYMPRNGPMRSLLELEQVSNVLPDYVRGEDWNLNGVLDANENDGSDSWPPDNADGILDAGWSAFITTRSVDGGLGESGEPRLELPFASSSDIARLLNTDSDQSDAIINLAILGSVSHGDFLRTDLNTLAQQNRVQSNSGGPLRSLSNEQLAVLLGETTMGAQPGLAGKINLNTISDDALEFLAEIPISVRDTIIFDRKSRAQGYTSMVDLLEVPGLTRDRVADLYDVADVRSNVYVATCRGRDERSGVEVEMIVTLDRSTLPIIIREIITR